ncbi:thiol:disulfide interchange protein DsbA/DsbL [Achromobacter sp. SIMBA_011]|uniref:thiol:disulfide interchange protein DsbA/DsbL n=1 Tax=Achromobacter TaxID=222 RepID=UPI0022B9363E|nr:thiol:disulfide interchange protein DsbA/DsbL [Achromobacter dolens]MCZ8406348.1 thiol:disulfide interchange protein DsbA/DsbL [Achromobacter dolens]
MFFRNCLRPLATSALSALLLANASVCHAQPAPAYARISPPLPSDTPGKIEVLEFFAYTCGHCAKIDPLIAQWSRHIPPGVVLKRVPIAYNANMRPMQQFYYALAALNRTDLHARFFDAIHNEHQRLFDRTAIEAWAVSQGLEKAKFDAAFDSFGVQVEMRRASQLAESYHIKGTPSFAVGGQYLTSPAMAGNSYAGAIQQVDHLIAMLQGHTQN